MKPLLIASLDRVEAGLGHPQAVLGGDVALLGKLVNYALNFGWLLERRATVCLDALDECSE
jgi:hypothetical protein